METAPHLVVNPTDPKNIAVAWTQDNADGIVVGVSHDRGDTWAKSVPPMTSMCAGGNYPSAFNQHLSFGPKGRLYLSTWNNDLNLARGRVTVHVSPDGGDTWSLPVTVEETTPADLRHIDHYSWVVADPNPSRAGTVYATWQFVDDSDQINFPYDMGFARSTDGGVTWSTPQTISPAPAGSDRLIPQLVVLPDGSLVNVFLQAPELTNESPTETGSVMAARSTDQGVTWSAPVKVAARKVAADDDGRVQKLGMSGRHALVNLPAVSSDGTIYYAWPSIESNGSSKIHLTSSSDGGVTWGEPRVIREATVPMAAVNIAVADDRLGVLFYDLRNDDPGTDAAEADVWFISAPGGAQEPAAWEERHVAGPSDVSTPGLATTIGSNQGIAGTPGGFVSAYTLGAPLSTVPTDIFFSRLKSNP